MARTTTTKVGKNMAAATKTEKKTDKAPTEKAKKTRIGFDYKKALNDSGQTVALDDNGKMTVPPHNWLKAIHNPLVRRDFDTKATYLRFKKVLLDLRITAIQVEKSDLDDEINEALKGPDPIKSKLKKVEKMATALAKLQAELKAEGIEIG